MTKQNDKESGKMVRNPSVASRLARLEDMVNINQNAPSPMAEEIIPIPDLGPDVINDVPMVHLSASNESVM